MLVIAGLVMGLAGLTFSGYFQRSSAKRTAQVFARDLTVARSAAVRSRQKVVIRFFEPGRWYQIVTMTSGTELVRRRFGVGGDVGLSGIDLLFGGDSVVFSARGVVDLTNAQTGTKCAASLGEASFVLGASAFVVCFNSMGASKVVAK